MPIFVRVPRNESVLKQFGPYPAVLNIGEPHETKLQRTVGRGGLSAFEPSTQATLLALVQLARSPANFFDVGAHVGVYSALIAAVFPRESVHVTAFEPTPRTAEICRSIAALNHLPVRVERCAISDADGLAELWISPWDTSNSLREGFRRTAESVSVATVSLDSYCASHRVDPSVIKVDVETLESQVLLGALDTLRRARPAIVCELLPAADPAPTEEALTALHRLGYRVHRWLRGYGWRACTMEDALHQTFHHGRDWLFTADDLDTRFHDALDAWLSAIAACTADTTVRTETNISRRPPPYHGL